MLLVTGDKGFVGRHLTKLLDKMGIKYVGYDLVDGKDIRDKYKLDSAFQDNGITHVIHLAALAGVRKGEMFPEEFLSTNIQGTINLIECSRRYGVKHFIFFSSSSVYGNQPAPNDEETKTEPISIYGATKMVGEHLVRMSGLPATVIRPFTLYGEDGRKDQVVYKWAHQHHKKQPISFYGDGTTKRGYTYVGDLVSTVVAILFNDFTKFEIYNLGGAEVISLEQLWQVFNSVFPDATRNMMKLPRGDVQENWADITKAKTKLGYDPQTKFEVKLREILTKIDFNKDKVVV